MKKVLSSALFFGLSLAAHPAAGGGQAGSSPCVLSTGLTARVAATRTSPLVVGQCAVFVYRGPARQVELVGDFTDWRPRALLFQRIEGTDVQYYARPFAPTARVEYKILADGQWLLDPLNGEQVDNGVGSQNSVLEMPGYRGVIVPAVKERDRGEITEAIVKSRFLQGARRVRVYLPARYDRDARRYPVLYLQDGSEYITRARAATVADALIAQKQVAPFLIVFVDPVDRMKEYWANDAFADFMARELVPMIDEKYRTRPTREARALMGASLGGVISVWTAMRYPQLFARVGGQSTAFWIDRERVVKAFDEFASDGRTPPFSFYFDVGRLESIREVNHRVQAMLAGEGYPVIYREAEAGHNWTSWHDRLATAFRSLWSAPQRKRVGKSI